MASLGREHQRLGQVVEAAKALERMDTELAQARELLSFDDPELAAEAKQEVARFEAAIPLAEAALKPLLLPPDPLHDRNAIVEIRAGTGGDEAALFAADLFRMYSGTSSCSGGAWRVEVISLSDGTSRRDQGSHLQGAGRRCFRAAAAGGGRAPGAASPRDREPGAASTPAPRRCGCCPRPRRST
jgi:protein subunit release factor A